MLNLFYAMKIFSHKSVASFRRELLRNGDPRRVCGLHDNSLKKKKLVPPARVFTGFMKKLVRNQELLNKIFDSLVEDMYDSIEGFGETLAGDGKIIQSYCKKKNDLDIEDGRTEVDANYTCKQYYYTDKNGKEKVKKHTYFGFKAHII